MKQNHAQCPKGIPKEFDRRWVAYAIAAGAGAIAATQPAQAGIIYNPVDTTYLNPTLTTIDLDGDSAADYDLWTVLPGKGDRRLWAQGSGYVSGSLTNNFTVENRLNLNDPIWTASATDSQVFMAAAYPGWYISSSSYGLAGVSGPWAAGNGDIVDGYLGFKFMIGADRHAGWAHLNVTPYGADPSTADITVRLLGYAYEDVAGKELLAGDTGPSGVPEPGTLGLLALGAVGLAALRRRQAKQ